MLAPIREYLVPRNPLSSQLLCATRDHYFTRLSVRIGPNRPGFQDSRWITSEDVNVEHLLDVYLSIDTLSRKSWKACARFVDHIYWHKPRQVVLGPKIEGLPDDHYYKSRCLYTLSRLFEKTGNHAEQKRVLTKALELDRRKDDDKAVASTLKGLSGANRLLGLNEEGIRQIEEASEIYKRLGDAIGQARCLTQLAWSLLRDGQLDSAEEAASRAIDLFSENGQEYQTCGTHRVLGNIHRWKGEKEKAIYHLETAIRIASSLNWHDQLYWIHRDLAWLFRDENELSKANAHAEQGKSYTADNAYYLGRAMMMQAQIWFLQNRLEEARTEVLHALEVFNKLGVAEYIGYCGDMLQKIETAMN